MGIVPWLIGLTGLLRVCKTNTVMRAVLEQSHLFYNFLDVTLSDGMPLPRVAGGLTVDATMQNCSYSG